MGTDPAAGPTHNPALCLCRDLMMGSRIRGAGVAVRIVRDPADLATADGPRLVADLNQPGALPAAAAWRARTGRPVVGFVSHVDADTIAAARSAGIDAVVARSRFVQQLPRLLAGEGLDRPG